MRQRQARGISVKKSSVRKEEGKRERNGGQTEREHAPRADVIEHHTLCADGVRESARHRGRAVPARDGLGVHALSGAVAARALVGVDCARHVRVRSFVHEQRDGYAHGVAWGRGWERRREGRVGVHERDELGGVVGVPEDDELARGGGLCGERVAGDFADDVAYAGVFLATQKEARRMEQERETKTYRDARWAPRRR